MRHAVITGASKGLGFVTAKVLSENGFEVTGIARKAPDEFPGNFYEADLSNAEATKEVLERIATERTVDALFNNVGTVNPQSIDEWTCESFDEVINLTLRTAMLTTQAFVPGMRAKGWGRIVNMSSILALGYPNRSSYCASKSAMLGLTRSWAMELVKDGITVNAVAPGFIETDLFRRANPPGSDGEKRYVSMIPNGRIGKPEDVAETVRFLMSESASYITGQTLYVDGGVTLGRLGF
ncbi:short-chain dehydrogenase [Fulvitalea axinellae]|uniref:Short-chain dehydrogenase n=1 Tax=Fulvitalea axinellae TaxID=1182444 RepID=A0AAU9CJ83_9BACT|nr:short-chain dehydrogenase [Fulvitalea axinellae]